MANIKNLDDDPSEEFLEAMGFEDVGSHWELTIDGAELSVEVATVSIEGDCLSFDGVPVIRNPSRGDVLKALKLLQLR